MNMQVSRRSFLLGSSALALSGCATSGVAGQGDRNVAPTSVSAGGLGIKFGVLSDIHITDWASTKILRKTLKYFKSQDVDAVMIVGDMADHGLLIQLENVAKAWEEVFPNDTGKGGRHVEKLFVYGNHDIEGLRYRDADMDGAFSVHKLSFEEAEKVTLVKLGLADCWEKCFHEKYEPIYLKTVKGYAFVGAHWDKWSGVDGLEDWFDANRAKIPTDRPFFFFQHCTPFGTIYGADTWGDDSGQSVRALMQYPNAVAFSGHSHRSLTDERSYWCGEFTSIGTSTLSYVCLSDNGRVNPTNYRKRLNCRQGQIVSVYDDRLEIERRDFIHDESLGDTIVLPMPTKVGTFTARGVKKSAIPQFPEGAQLTLECEKKTFALTFPGAFANPTALPFDYRVSSRFVVKGKDGKEQTKYKEWLFYQPSAAFSRARAAAKPIRFVLPAKDIAKDIVSGSISVIARNCYGVQGKKWLDAKVVAEVKPEAAKKQ